MTKRNLLLFNVLFLGVFAYSQPSITVQAYKQVVMPGTIPVGINGDNPSSARIGARASTNYHLYFSHPKKETVQPVKVWINKKAYKIKVEPVAKTPVEHISRNIPTRPITTVLVAKTTNKVVRLVPLAPADSVAHSATAKKLMETSELVVSYKWKGKTYHKAIKKITELEPEMME